MESRLELFPRKQPNVGEEHALWIMTFKQNVDLPTGRVRVLMFFPPVFPNCSLSYFTFTCTLSSGPKSAARWYFACRRKHYLCLG